ncbi:MAG: hypothetical protein AMJ46_06675 [Latescibacteria bacterium DG_63]|nr:MAG: hypothetical protein AMJ46_06675 [Latescibacteria bacterium DG_63]
MAQVLIRDARQLITCAGGGVRTGAGMETLGIVENGSVLIDGERIEAVGPTEKVERALSSSSVEIIDAKGMVVTPGFVDPHTHLVYAGSREEEFALRLQGMSYSEITKRGGGIMSTVRATREASEEHLTEIGMKRLGRLLSYGTTTVEVKSGYGLDIDSELKQLRVAKRLGDSQPVDVASTFLGAHAIPPNQSPGQYTRTIIENMLPEVSRTGLAQFCDVFCEEGFFGYEASKEILTEAAVLGFKLKVHADELSSSRGSELAGELRAVSADHVVYPSDAGIASMLEGGVVAVLLPGTVFMLGLAERPPARKLIASGVPVALATDHNPGTCTVESMQIIMGLAVLLLGMSPAETLVASTLNAAYAIDRGDEIGSLEAGKLADLLVFDVPTYEGLLYDFTTNHLEYVLKRGKVVHSK